MMTPRSVYIHIPFCRHRCGYCNFALVAGRDHLIDRFLDALEKEIGWLKHRYQIDTLFFGGGTPSHLAANQLMRLANIIRSRFDLAGKAEVTTECNPVDLNADKLDALTQLGVNRISLGVQSMDPEKLEILERDHTPGIVGAAVELAKANMRTVSIDMIFAAPGESFTDWKADLDKAIQLAPCHISTYELTYEKGTLFWNRLQRNELNQSTEDLRAEMFVHTQKRLAAAGYEQYEISSFARPGHRCRHNQVYWSGEPYLAFGPGAASYVEGVRSTNHASTIRYMQLIESDRSPVSESETLDAESSARELLAIGLRRIGGVDLTQFKQRTGFDAEQLIAGARDRLVKTDLLVQKDDQLLLSSKGILLYDGVAAEILHSERETDNLESP